MDRFFKRRLGSFETLTRRVICCGFALTALRFADAPPSPRGRGFAVGFHVADHVANSGLLAFTLERLGDCAGGRSGELDRHLLGFNDDDGFILFDRIAWILEPVTDLDFAYRFAD